MCPVPPDMMQEEIQSTTLEGSFTKNVESKSDQTLRFNYHFAEIQETEDYR